MKHILFLHSAGEQTETTGSNPLIQYLKEHVNDAQWYTPEMPLSAGKIYQAWARVVKATLLDIPIDEPLIIIAHSFSGTVIMKYLTENEDAHQITKVILIGSPFYGCDDEFVEPQNELLADAAKRFKHEIDLFDIQSVDDDRVNVRHQQCWKDVFNQMTLITKHSGKHEFHEGIPELVDIINA